MSTDVGVSEAGESLMLTRDVMSFNVNQNLDEVVSPYVTLKPTHPLSGGGMNVGSTNEHKFARANTAIGRAKIFRYLSKSRARNSVTKRNP